MKRRSCTLAWMTLGWAALALGGCALLLPNRPPVASFTLDDTDGYAPLTVRLDGRESYDPDGQIVAYRWIVSDERVVEGGVAEHTFTASGSFTVRLEVEDRDGAVGTAAVTIVVRRPPEGYLARRREWDHGGVHHTWDLLVPEALYEEYAGRVQTSFSDRYRYDVYVADPLDDPTLESFGRELLDRVGGDPVAFLECALAFVQGAIRYALDTPGLEQPRYPLETLVDGKGDCEDAAILYVNLVNALDADASLAFVDTDGDRSPDHVTALVPVPTFYSGQLHCGGTTRERLFVFDGELLALAEASVAVEETGYIALGCDPWGLDEEDVIQRWTFEEP
ncbi:MAG: PKD domain-containing protein [Candidatus Bipolaricaulota bacterium]|nr:MAG: PKD domain-containing protein [Candidatus Bipolaricaulota bacterium]